VPATSALKEIFAANRAIGRVSLEVGVAGGVTRRVRVAEDGPLRVRCPGSDGASLEAMIVNTAGGIAGGDRHRLDIAAGGRHHRRRGKGLSLAWAGRRNRCHAQGCKRFAARLAAAGNHRVRPGAAGAPHRCRSRG
jgi:hypothetical protein